MKTSATGILTIAAFSIAASLSLPGVAEQAPEATIPAASTGIQTVSIQYAPAQLSSDEGRADLHGKIRRAAREVCGPTGLREAGNLTIASRNRKCMEQAMSAAMSQVESSQLAQMGY